MGIFAKKFCFVLVLFFLGLVHILALFLMFPELFNTGKNFNTIFREWTSKLYFHLRDWLDLELK
jgi:hypothetical protein